MTPEQKAADELRVKLSQRALSQRPRLEVNRRILTGDIAPSIPAEVARLFDVQRVRVPLAAKRIDAICERLHCTGFRSSPDDVADNALDALANATRFWPAARLAMADALSYGWGGLAVGVDGSGRVVVTAQSPMTTSYLTDPLTGVVTAAQVQWRDPADSSLWWATWTPDAVYTWHSPRTSPEAALMAYDLPAMGGTVDLVDEQPNPLGVVPFIPFINRPTSARPAEGTSDVECVEDLIRSLSQTITDQQVAVEALAMPATVLMTQAQVNAEQAMQIRQAFLESITQPGGARASVLGGGSSIHQTDAATLDNFRTGSETLTDLIAAQLDLPGYWLRSNIANPVGAEAIRASEYRLTMAVRERQRWFAPALVDAMRLVQRASDGYFDPRLDTLEPVWADPEPRTLAQEADAVAKLVGAGILDHRAALAELDIAPLETERIIAATPTPTPTIA